MLLKLARATADELRESSLCMKAFGSQIIAEMIGCQSDILNQRQALEDLLSEGIARFQLTLKSINSFQFEPVGITAIAIIGESHVAIHTYPEERHLSLDIFTCSSGSTGPMQLMRFLQEHLQPDYLRYKELARGLSIDLLEKDYITDLTSSSFNIRYHIEREVLNQRTAYQHLIIVDNKEFGRLLFLDNELQIADSDAHIYNQALVQPLQAAKAPLQRVAILGGGDGGILNTLLQTSSAELLLFEIDRQVISAARTHLSSICGSAFEDSRTQLYLGEASQLLANENQLDAVVYDLTMSPEAAAQEQKEQYLEQLFATIARSLKPGGILSLQVGSRFDAQSQARARKLLAQHFVEIQFKEVYIPSFCEGWIFAQAIRPD